MLHHLLAMFRPVPLSRLASEDLYEAKRDLLAASKNREYWESQERMLMSRVDRLNEEILSEDIVKDSTYNPNILDLPITPPPMPKVATSKTDPSFINSRVGHP